MAVLRMRSALPIGGLVVVIGPSENIQHNYQLIVQM